MVIRAIRLFNLQFNNAAREIERKCWPYYLPLNPVDNNLHHTLSHTFNQSWSQSEKNKIYNLKISNFLTDRLVRCL